MSYPSTNPRQLLKDQTEQCHPFQVEGVDYAGPIYCRPKSNTKLKSYILLFSCTVLKAVNLELEPNLTTQVFIKSLKKLIAICGSPKIMYADNAKTFKA